MISICCVGFASLDVVCDELISSATMIIRVGGAIWLNPCATVLFTVCNIFLVGPKALFRLTRNMMGNSGDTILPFHTCKRNMANNFSAFFYNKNIEH